jgi:hypothetical protein
MSVFSRDANIIIIQPDHISSPNIQRNLIVIFDKIFLYKLT